MFSCQELLEALGFPNNHITSPVSSRSPAQRRSIYKIKIYDYIPGPVIDKCFITNISSSCLAGLGASWVAYRKVNALLSTRVLSTGSRVQMLNHNSGSTKRPMIKVLLLDHAPA